MFTLPGFKPLAGLRTRAITSCEPMKESLVVEQGERAEIRIEQWMWDFVSFVRSENTHVFLHHIYEYKKGLRNLILHTTHRKNESKIRKKLEQHQIAYVIYPLGQEKMNVFFGEQICIDVIKQIGKDHLTGYTPEEDFILGIMLGYDRRKQCERYLQRKQQYPTDQLIG
jgi:hypothetical protein